MKTTLEIDARLVQQLQEVADRRRTTLSALVEAGIFQILGMEQELEQAAARKRGDPLPELPVWKGSVELVDISNREELYRVMDEYDGFRY